MNRVRRSPGDCALPHAARAGVARRVRAAQRNNVTELKPPQPTESDGKIEVLEFFWYGCIHCYNLEPRLETWLKKLPADVRVPPRARGAFTTAGRHDAVVFYAFEALGVLDKLHRPFFDAIHLRAAAHRQPARRSMRGWKSRASIRRSSRPPRKLVRRAEQGEARHPLTRTTGSTAHPRWRCTGRYTIARERDHARHRRPAGRRGPQEQVAGNSASRHHRRLLWYRRGAGAALRGSRSDPRADLASRSQSRPFEGACLPRRRDRRARALARSGEGFHRPLRRCPTW